MSKIDELLKNEKVEWKKLGDIKEIMVVSPKKKLNRKEYLDEGIYPVIDQGQSFIVGYTNDTSAAFENNKYIVFGDHTESLKYVDFPFVQGADGIKVLKTNEKCINSRYLYHAISNFYEIRGEYKRHFSILKATEIPIPSLETQEKIVEILDKFTNYVTELQAELQARNKQYEYYRDMLLSEEYLKKLSENPDVLGIRYGVTKTTLGEIGEIKMCKRILKDQTFPQGDIPFYKIGTFGKRADAFIKRDLFNEYKEKYSYPRKGEILISASGTIGRTVIFDGNDAYFQDSNIVWIDNNEDLVLNKYLYYFYQIVNWNPSSGGTIKRLYNYNLKNIKIILPPIAIQNKVVEVLDRFQELIENSRGLLPEEIEKRQKQYEYYREKLLTFQCECDSKPQAAI